jgi:Leucine-rich repeat (LRR) protein
MGNLRELVLDENYITEMPPEIAQLTALVRFSANDNKISTLANVPGTSRTPPLFVNKKNTTDIFIETL